MRKREFIAQTAREKMKWSWLGNEATIGMQKERQTKKKKRQKKKPTGGALLLTEALLHSMMLAKLLGRDNKNAQQKRAIASMLTKSNMNGMGRLWKKFLNSKYPLPQKQIKQLVRDKKLIDLFFDSRIPLDTRRRIVAQEGGFLGFLLPLITKVATPLVGSVAHNYLVKLHIVGRGEHELQNQLSHAQKRIQMSDRTKTATSSFRQVTGSACKKITYPQKACKTKGDDIRKAGEDQKGQIPQ